jgi:hypothetical protein
MPEGNVSRGFGFQDPAETSRPQPHPSQLGTVPVPPAAPMKLLPDGYTAPGQQQQGQNRNRHFAHGMGEARPGGDLPSAAGAPEEAAGAGEAAAGAGEAAGIGELAELAPLAPLALLA